MVNPFKSKRIETLVEITVLTCTTYLVIQKFTNFSLSEYAKNFFHADFLNKAMPHIRLGTGIVILICLCFKAYYVFRDKLQKPAFDHSDTGKFIEVISLFQTTTAELIARVLDSKCCCTSRISDRKRFSVFAQGIAKNLAEFVAVGFKDTKFRRKNLFISLYEYVETDKGRALQHLFHEDSKTYDVYTTVMLIDGEEHQKYECVKAIKEDRNMTAILNAQELRVPGRKRHKTMKHYIGAPVKVAGQLVGFLNLEFHREKYFSDEDELEEFAQQFFLPFQMLTEQAFAKWQLAQSVESKCGCKTQPLNVV